LQIKYPDIAWSIFTYKIRKKFLNKSNNFSVYTSEFLNASISGLHDTLYQPFGAVCLEDQNFVDAVNHPNFPSCILRPGAVYKHVCEIEIAPTEKSEWRKMCLRGTFFFLYVIFWRASPIGFNLHSLLVYGTFFSVVWFLNEFLFTSIHVFVGVETFYSVCDLFLTSFCWLQFILFSSNERFHDLFLMSFCWFRFTFLLYEIL
jgi:hypothetical protein